MDELWLPREARYAVWVADAEQIVVIGWRPGPAGVSSIDLTPTLRMTVDHAAPLTLAELTVTAPGGRPSPGDLRILTAILGADAARNLAGLSTADLGDRPLRLDGPVRSGDIRPIDPDVARWVARMVLGADLAEDDDLPERARNLAALEAGRAAAAFEDVIGREFAVSLLRRSLAGLRDLVDPRRDDPRYTHDLMGRLATASGFVEVHDRAPELWERALDQVDDVLDLYRSWTRLYGPGGSTVARRVAVPTADDFAAPAAAAAPMVARSAKLAVGRRRERAEEAVEVDATPGPRALAWIDRGGNVEITAPRSLEGSWARVFRRRGELLLGLSPLLPAVDTAGVEATVVVPSGHGAADLVVDVTHEPAEARPSATLVELREAVRSGRLAARYDRLQSDDAPPAWRACAAQWWSLGDDTRANLAERYAAGSPRRNESGDALVADLMADPLPRRVR